MADLSIVGIPSPAAAPYFGWDLVRDVQELFRYAFMQHAFEAGTVVALTAGVIGYFVVLRGLSFAAHGLSHIGFAGATGAVLLGLAPIVGLLAFTMSAGALMGALGQRLRRRDVTIRLGMAWSLGLGLLFTAPYKGSAARAGGVPARPIRGIMVSAALAVLFPWAGLTVAYYVPYRVGFFIPTFAFGSYVVARLLSSLAARRTRPRGWREAQVRHSP